MNSQSLTTYLQDHYAGSCAGVDVFRRVASGHGRPAVRMTVERLTGEIEEDQQSLVKLMAAVGAKPSMLKSVTARVGEKVGRAKPNQRLVRRSPLSDLLELEALTLAVTGKALGWKTLLALQDPRIPIAEVETLLTRAEAQADELNRLRLDCVDVLQEK